MWMYAYQVQRAQLFASLNIYRILVVILSLYQKYFFNQKYFNSNFNLIRYCSQIKIQKSFLALPLERLSFFRKAHHSIPARIAIKTNNISEKLRLRTTPSCFHLLCRLSREIVSDYRGKHKILYEKSFLEFRDTEKVEQKYQQSSFELFFS